MHLHGIDIAPDVEHNTIIMSGLLLLNYVLDSVSPSSPCSHVRRIGMQAAPALPHAASAFAAPLLSGVRLGGRIRSNLSSQRYSLLCTEK